MSDSKVEINFDIVSNKPGVLSGTAYSLFNIEDKTISIDPPKLTNLYHTGLSVFDSEEFSTIARNFINQCINSVSSETQSEIVNTIEFIKKDPLLVSLVKLNKGSIRMNFVIVIGSEEGNINKIVIKNGTVTSSVVLDPA